MSGALLTRVDKHTMDVWSNEGTDGESEDGESLEAYDSSYERNTPYFTKHGNGLTCEGLEEALHTMRPGGRRRIILPANIGFTGDKGPLPPGEKSRDALVGAVGRVLGLLLLELGSRQPPPPLAWPSLHPSTV